MTGAALDTAEGAPGGEARHAAGLRRCIESDATPETALRVIPLDRLREELPRETPAVTPAERNAVLERRARALQRRYAY
jgi:hypothetical protein